MKEVRASKDVVFANFYRPTNAHEPEVLPTPPCDGRESHCPHALKQHVEARVTRELGFRRKFEGRARPKAHVDQSVVAVIDVSAKFSGMLPGWFQPDDRSVIILCPFGPQHCGSWRQRVEEFLKYHHQAIRVFICGFIDRTHD